MINKLLDLQERIFKYHTSDYPYNLEYSPRILFSKIGDLYEIVYYGDGYDDDYTVNSSVLQLEEGYNYGFAALLDFLIKNPRNIASLIFAGPDTGANGVLSWNFNRIIHSDVWFENLQWFQVALTDAGSHNQSVIGEYYDEEGMIAKLVSKMPKLEFLQVPSAPDISFFDPERLPVRRLVVQAGYDSQNFIRNLAMNSRKLKNLMSLDYTDILSTDAPLTSFENYKILFESDLFANYRHFHFTLRTSGFTRSQLAELQMIRDIQFLYIDTRAGKYIRLKK